MTKRKPDVYLQDVLESIQQIETYLKDVSEDKFYQNTEKQDAVMRRLEIIGEAVKHVPEEIRKSHDLFRSRGERDLENWQDFLF